MLCQTNLLHQQKHIGDIMQPRWKEPLSTPEGELLTIVKQIEASVIKQTQKAGMCKGAMCKNMSCMDDPSCGAKGNMEKGNYMDKASMGEKNAYCQKNYGKDYSECTPEQKARCDEHCGKVSKMGYDKMNYDKMGKYANDHKEESGPETGSYKSDRGMKADRNKNGKIEGWEAAISDKIKANQNKHKKKEKVSKEDPTAQFLREKGIVVKYEQEPNIENNVPTFMDHSGGVPVEAINYHTNQTMPFYTDKAPKNTFISEKAQIPSAAQTGYDEKASTLHMHLNDKGGTYQWTAPITDAMMSLKKSGVGNPGIIEQIAQEVEQLVGRLS